MNTVKGDEMRADKFKDECGVFGIFGHPDAAHMTYLGLYALQHRGQESAGIAVARNRHIKLARACLLYTSPSPRDVEDRGSREKRG